MLLGNVQKKWQQTPSAIVTACEVDRLLVFIMKLEMAVNFCPILIDSAAWGFAVLYLSELYKSIHLLICLKSNFYDSAVIQ